MSAGLPNHRRPSRHLGPLGLVLLTTLTAGLCGCTGHGRLTLVPMNTSTITPKSQLQFGFPFQRCYWWVEDDQLCLAFSYHNFSIAGDLTRDSLELSLLFDQPPPEDQQQYRTTRDTLRGIWHRSGWHLRMKPRRGVLSAVNRSADVLEGRFRILCSSEKFWVLTGWQRQSPVLLQGNFTAVRNRQEGLKILARTEESYPRGQDTGKITFEPGN